MVADDRGSLWKWQLFRRPSFACRERFDGIVAGPVFNGPCASDKLRQWPISVEISSDRTRSANCVRKKNEKKSHIKSNLIYWTHIPTNSQTFEIWIQHSNGLRVFIRSFQLSGARCIVFEQSEFHVRFSRPFSWMNAIGDCVLDAKRHTIDWLFCSNHSNGARSIQPS